MKTNFKALIFDLDGTAVPNKPDGMPSVAVIQAIQKAQENVKVACATGREIGIAKEIIQTLQLTSPCIVAGGAQIIDPISFEPVWEKLISESQIRQIINLCKEFPYTIESVADGLGGIPIAQYNHFAAKPILFISGIKKEDAPLMMKKLEKIGGINLLVMPSWTKDGLDIQITNDGASKKHALQEWLKIERVKKAQVMAIGDGLNDVALFEAAGLKVAMGNAQDALKALADWVAPTVDEDGLAVAIEKYILV